MRVQGMARGLEELVSVFGYTRQNYYQRRHHQVVQKSKEAAILNQVKQIRGIQKNIGTTKLQYLLNEQLGAGTIGRDALYRLLRRHHLLIRRRKRYRPKQTGGDGESIYPDLRKDLVVNKGNQLWSTDITYLTLRNPVSHAYLCCIVDEYSHLIVGYRLAVNMKKERVLEALQQAVDSQLQGAPDFAHKLILHSDRGGQFKSQAYQALTDHYKIKRSMCAAGRSHENPVAERLNGILKNELMDQPSFHDFNQAQKVVDQTIEIYNEQRPHLSCNMLTPRKAHQATGMLKKLWRQRKNKTDYPGG